jgi:hypothetical protein
MRRMFIAVLAGLLLLPATVATAEPPADSGIVDRVSAGDTALIVDFDADLLVLVNVISVEDFCDRRPAGDGLVQVLELPDGVISVTVSDDDTPVVVVPAPDSLEELCADPATYPVIATGTANFRLSDNDALGSGTRGNIFGSQLQGTVTDDDGNAYTLTAFVRLQVTPDGGFTPLREDVSLIPR